MVLQQESLNENTVMTVTDLITPMSKLRIIKNLAVISAGCLLTFSAFDGLIPLQSTINQEQGIGVISSAVQFAVSCISALLLPKYLITKFGTKVVMIVSSVALIPFIAVNYKPSWALMIITSILTGCGWSLLWSSQCAYLNQSSVLFAEYLATSNNGAYAPSGGRGLESRYTVKRLKEVFIPARKSFDISLYSVSAEIDKRSVPNHENNCSEKAASELNRRNNSVVDVTTVQNHANRSHIIESTTARIFGFHAMMYQSCYIWSSLISYYILQRDSGEFEPLNGTACLCGADFCNVATVCSAEKLREPNIETRYILLSVYVALSVASVILVSIFLDTLKSKVENVSLSSDLLMATLRRVKVKNQFLLIPLTIYIGMGQGFYSGDFSKAYIACEWGIRQIGIVTVCCGFFMAISSTLSGYFVKHLGRLPIFVFVIAENVAMFSILLLWHPNASKPIMFFVAAGVWGSLFGILWSQVRAFYGVLFKDDEEAAFGSYQLWHSFGTCLSFAYSNYLCTYVKVYIMLALFIVGITGYFIVEVSYLRKNIKK